MARLPYVLLVPVNLISSLSKLVLANALIVSFPVKRSNDVNARLLSIFRSKMSGAVGDAVAVNQDNMLAMVADNSPEDFVIERCLTHSFDSDHDLLHSSHIHVPALAWYIPS